MTVEEIRGRLSKVLSEKRYAHSIGVMEVAENLAEKYGVDPFKAKLAGLLHDCARNISGQEAIAFCTKNQMELDEISLKQPQLLHGPIGAKLAELEYEITEPEVINAIANHTLGCENMSCLDKIIFLADYIEPGRVFPGVEEIRRIVWTDLDGAMILAYDSTFRHCLKKGGLIHPKAVFSRNFILLQRI